MTTGVNWTDGGSYRGFAGEAVAVERSASRATSCVTRRITASVNGRSSSVINHRLRCRSRRPMASAVCSWCTRRLDIDPHAWTPRHLSVIRAAAREPSVERIFVNAAIKKALCREAKGDRSWLWRSAPCTVTTITSISASSVLRVTRSANPSLRHRRKKGAVPAISPIGSATPCCIRNRRRCRRSRSRPLTLAQLPSDCRQVLAAPDARP